MLSSKKNFNVILYILLNILLICIILSAVIFTPGIVQAEVFGLNIANEDECRIGANKWIEGNYDDDTIIDKIVPIMENETLSAYCVNLSLNDEPNGYVVIDADKTATNHIIEFALSGEGIYDTLRDNSDTVIKEADNKKIYSIGTYNYAIQTSKNSNKFYSSNAEFLTKDVVKDLGQIAKELKSNAMRSTLSKSRSSLIGGFFDESSITDKTITSSRNITNLNGFIPSLMIMFTPKNKPANSYLNENNCSLTAATNLLSYYKENRGLNNLTEGSRQLTYNWLVKETGFDEIVYDKSKLIGCSDATINSALKKYVKNKSYKYSSATYWFDLWSDWKRDIDDNFPVYTSVQGSVYYGNENYKKEGHASIAIGYREYSDNSKFLRVIDGWNTRTDRYLKFDGNYFDSKDGTCIKIS